MTTAVERARELIEAAARGGRVRLPGLTELDLCVLGGYLQAAFDAPVLASWLAASDDQRGAMTDASLEVLTERGLVRGTAEGTVAQVDPALGLILEARRSPAFVVLGVEGDSDRTRAPRLYGMGDEASGTLTVLCEQVLPRVVAAFGQAVDYALTSPEQAAALMVAWVLDAATETPRQVQMVCPDDNGPRTVAWTFTAGPGGALAVRARDTVLDSATELADVLTRSMRTAGDAAR